MSAGQESGSPIRENRTLLPAPLPPDEARGDARRRSGGVYGRATPSLRHPRCGILILFVAPFSP
jgi:hypothetical protein